MTSLCAVAPARHPRNYEPLAAGFFAPPSDLASCGRRACLESGDRSGGDPKAGDDHDCCGDEGQPPGPGEDHQLRMPRRTVGSSRTPAFDAVSGRYEKEAGADERGRHPGAVGDHEDRPEPSPAQGNAAQ